MTLLVASKEKILNHIREFVLNSAHSVKRFFRSLKRSYDFAKIGWSNPDWDYGYLLQLMLFKLERMQHALDNGHAEHEKSTTQSLRICIKLLTKICYKDYSHFMNIYSDKWGPTQYEYADSEEVGFKVVKSSRKNVKSEEDKVQANKDLFEAFQKDCKQEERDSRLLFAIMAKYHKTWWD